MLTTMELYDDAALAALIADATLLGANLKAGLYVNSPTISKQNVIADLTEPGYAGYARQAVLLGAPSRDPQNGIVSIAPGLVWQEGGAITPVTVNGIFYTYGVVPKLLGIEPFAVPQTLVDALSAFTTVLQYIQSSENAGLTTVIV